MKLLRLVAVGLLLVNAVLYAVFMLLTRRLAAYDSPETIQYLPAVVAAVLAWIEHRGAHPGALFNPLDRPRQRLTGNGVYHLVRDLGRQVGIQTRPHGIRHAAITAVLDATNGDMRKAQAFGRHASASTTVTYDDNRQDLSGSAARILDALVE